MVKKFHHFVHFLCLYNVAGIAYGTGCTMRGSNPGRGQDISLLQNFQIGMKFTIRLYLVPRLRISGAVPVYMVLGGKPEGKRPLGRHRRRWEDNINMDLRKLVGGHGLDRAGSG